MPTPRDRRTPRPTARRGAAALLLAGSLAPLALAVAGAGPAAAHDRLESTDPADGAVLDVAPDAVVLTMSSAPLALGTQVQVTGPDGVVSSGEVRVVDETVTQPVTGARPAGTYQVQWRVTSSDGHPVSGSFAFTTTSATGVPASATASPAPSASTSAPGTLDPSGAAVGGDRGVLLAVAAAVVVVGGGAGGIIGYRRRRR